MQFLLKYIRQIRRKIIIFILFVLVFLSAFILYHLPVEAVIYPAIICAIVGAGFLIYDYFGALRKHKELEEIKKFTAELMDVFPEKVSIEASDYQQIIEKLRDEKLQLKTQMEFKYTDMADYYAVWVHQIKTPIASMRLNLQNEDTELSRRLTYDLFRIEQYVDMVLCYFRLDSDSTDYVFKEYELDDIVKQAVHKFAGQFIRRGIKLNYKPLTEKVITDEKWLLFVIEQVLSNALKYTMEGSITISIEKPKTLCIKDTGIGIAPEDLPRVFEKGYTGYNGRSDKKASGLGLYLCRRICSKLGYTIKAESLLDSGTEIRINLEKQDIEFE